ncbi:universal stress protein [Anaeromyxobacter terrae]|uniref:universal stress protein n=1 Tax=Anaeromyxobacter terrae TaxID=2925406 RepID=UPI001F58AD24|nr:universal stress protein [Anaeromyxobacter sp. SG22]
MVAARICCAIDFSEASLLALVEAAELARWSGAELRLIHVHAVPEGEVRPEAFEMSAVDLHRDVAVWRAEAERRTGALVNAEVVAGDPATEILRLARHCDADLLVLGARGRSAPGGRRLGSVAARVAREAPCPVIVVRARVPLPDEGPARHAA